MGFWKFYPFGVHKITSYINKFNKGKEDINLELNTLTFVRKLQDEDHIQSEYSLIYSVFRWVHRPKLSLNLLPSKTSPLASASYTSGALGWSQTPRKLNFSAQQRSSAATKFLVNKRYYSLLFKLTVINRMYRGYHLELAPT